MNPGEDEATPEVIICAGPPLCPFEGEEAVICAKHGCPRCTHVVVHPDGRQTQYQIKPN